MLDREVQALEESQLYDAEGRYLPAYQPRGPPRAIEPLTSSDFMTAAPWRPFGSSMATLTAARWWTPPRQLPAGPQRAILPSPTFEEGPVVQPTQAGSSTDAEVDELDEE